jgi:hypothetical protein
MLKTIQERGVILLIDMIGIPKARLAHAFSAAMASEPGLGCGVDQRSMVVAEQRDGVSFDIAATPPMSVASYA